MSATAYIGLGSNLGDRRGYLERALQILRGRPGISVSRVSPFVETAPVGGPPGQGPYLNAAAELQTDLEPEALLRTLLEVERFLGRVRGERHGPRTIDLDLLLYGEAVRSGPELTLPHPRMQDRLFVLEPLAAIAPDAVHPVLRRTIRDLLAAQGGAAAGAQHGGEAPAPAVRPGGVPLASRMELDGLRAVVTGSTSGIGRAIALEFARAGADVVVHGRRGAPAEEVADAIRAAGKRAVPVLADLADADGCRRLARSAWEAWGGVDVWVNNAGADTLTGEASQWSFERKLRELLAVDVTATVLLSRDVGRRMKARGGGVIVNMGWDKAESGMEGDSAELISTSKGAVAAFSRSLALSLAPEVRVNCLAPGWIRTSWGTTASARWQERVAKETPLARWGTPEDVAAAARWLASPAASFITGQTIRINGGVVR